VKIFKIDEGDVFISDEVSKEYEVKMSEHEVFESLEELIASNIDILFTNRVYSELTGFLEQWKMKYPGVAILNAHGIRINGIWYYTDKGKLKPVQSWINKFDGKYGTLVLLLCDDSEATSPLSKHSLLICPDGLVGGKMLLHECQYHFLFLHPTYGEICSYTADHATKTLLE
jgi:hypothetical protein